MGTEKASQDPLSYQVLCLSKQVLDHGEILNTLKDVPSLLKQLMQTQSLSSSCMQDQVVSDNESETDENFEHLLNESTSKEDGEITEDPEIASLLEYAEGSVEYGPPLSVVVASAFKSTIEKPLAKEALVKVKERIKVPENCKELQAPKMNPEIWNNLPPNAKFIDLKTQSHQQSIGHGIAAFAKIAEEIARNPGEIGKELKSSILKLTKDGSYALGNCVHDLTLKRRMDVKPSVKLEYQGICSSTTPATDLLFGNSLAESLRSTKAAASIVKGTGLKSSRFSPYQRFNKNLNRNRPFFHSRQNQRGNGQKQLPYQMKSSPAQSFRQFQRKQ